MTFQERVDYTIGLLERSRASEAMVVRDLLESIRDDHDEEAMVSSLDELIGWAVFARNEITERDMTRDELIEAAGIY